MTSCCNEKIFSFRNHGRRHSFHPDIVGYTALAQKDEALALELLKEEELIIRRIISEYNGREIKTIGDAFLIEFPSALDATSFAIEIQNAFRERNSKQSEDKGFTTRR